MNSFPIRREALATIIGCLLVVLIPLLLGNKSLIDVVTRLAIYGLFALSLNLLIGYTGLVSFGHAMFFGFGAYAFALLLRLGALSIPSAFVLSLLGAAVLAAAVGVLCIRLTAIYFAFLTLAFQMLIHAVILSWVSLTGGDQGLQGGIPRPPFLGIDLGQPTHFYAVTCILFFACVFLMRQILESPFGYALRMIRDNPERATALGLPVQRYKLASFVIAGVFAAVSGLLMSLYVSGAYPNFAFWTLSGDGIFMIILGGMGVFLGPVVGAAVFLLLNDVVTRFTEYHGIVMGVVLLFVVLGLRRGLLDLTLDLGHRLRTAVANKKA